MKIIIKNNYIDPEDSYMEVVERKGMGHPDTLADKLAEICSRTYSNYCLNKFGCVLHHNFDKLYIGAGCFRYENNKIVMYDKVKVYLNGRVSNTMNGENVDVEAILVPVIKDYLKSVLPNLDVENELEIHINATQNTKINNWFTPRNINDVPDAREIFSGDTSLCLASTGFTTCEKLCFEIEKFFFNRNEKGYPYPKFDDVGQDIKVMVSRIDKDVDITMCLPVYSYKYKTYEEYVEIIKKYERMINKLVMDIDNTSKYNYTININKFSDGAYYRYYSLVKGSCIECGEEGVVGRGNKSSGLISSFRPHTMEAPYGKNERYHTGRVLDFLCKELSEKIYNKYGIKNSIYCIARNKNPLLKPYFFCISTKENIEKAKVENLIRKIFDEKTYLKRILQQIDIY